MTQYQQLTQKARDKGVEFGIYSQEYADAVHEMSDFWVRNVTKRELFLNKLWAKTTFKSRK